MKHYLYISDAKLDMMAAQVPRKLRNRIAATLLRRPPASQ